MFKLSQYILCVFFFLCFLKNNIYAEFKFVDDFSDTNNVNWEYKENDGSIIYENGYAKLESSLERFPVLYSKFGNFFLEDEDSALRIRFKYNNFAGMGSGIGIGFTGHTDYPFFQFSIWQDSINGTLFSYNDFSLPKYHNCSVFNEYEDLVDRKNISLNLSFDWHELEISKKGTQYLIYIDRKVNKDPIYITEHNQCIPKNLIIGNPLSGGSYDWNSLSIDYLKLSGEKNNEKIFVIPGLGASWNSRAIVYGEQVTEDEWAMTPFVNNYNDLFNAFNQIGLEKNTDYYVWNYDWRKPVEEITESFDNYVDSKTSAGEKVNIIGHSLGGVVGRNWLQKDNNDQKVNKLITLGSPHKGAISAYEAWSGAKISDGFDPAKIALKIIATLKSSNMLNQVGAVREYAPVLKDLLPIFDFAKRSNRIVPWTMLESKNDFLLNLSSNISEPELGKIFSIAAVGENTSEWINMGSRTVFDEVLSLWPDGRPISYKSGVGDGTVLKKSAMINSNNFYQLNSDHGGMVTDSIDRILSELGLEAVGTSMASSTNLDGTIFFIASPAFLQVKCGEKDYVSDEHGFVLADKYDGECDVKVVGEDEGVYHLLFGNVDAQDWFYLENKTAKGKVDEFSINGISGELWKNANSLGLIYQSIEEELRELSSIYGNDDNLEEVIICAKNNNSECVVKWLFMFREKSKETFKTGMIIDKLKTLLEKSINSNQAKSYYQTALSKKSLVDNVTRLNLRKRKRPTEFGSASYNKMADLVEELKIYWNKRDYSKVYSNSLLIPYFANEVWLK